MDTNRPGFQPLGCGCIWTQGFALGWYRSAPLALETSAGCGVPDVDFERELLDVHFGVWTFRVRHNFDFFSN